MSPDNQDYIDNLGEDEYFAEENPLLELFGENPKAILKVIDTLLDHSSYPYNKKELAEINDISPSTLYRHWDTLENHKIVEVDKIQGGTTLWTLNSPEISREKCENCGQRINSDEWRTEDEIIEHLFKLADAVMRFRKEKGIAKTEKVGED